MSATVTVTKVASSSGGKAKSSTQLAKTSPVSRPDDLRQLRRSYKVKNNSVSLVSAENPELGLKTSVENAPSKVGWKNSKIFSRTLSSIEVIRAMKSKSPSPSTATTSLSPTLVCANQSVVKEVFIPSTSPSSLSPQHQPSINRTLTAQGSSIEGSPSSAARKSKAVSEWKVLKSKLSALRKKSAPTDENQENEEDRQNRKSSGCRQCSTGSARNSRSGSQDEGIVCRKEDLLNLLYEAAKLASSDLGKLKSLETPGSPDGSSIRKSTQFKAASCTPQASEIVAPKTARKSALKKNLTMEAGAKSEEKVDFIETKIVVPQLKSALKHDTHTSNFDRSGKHRTSRSSRLEAAKTTFYEPKKEEASKSVMVREASFRDKHVGDENRNVLIQEEVKVESEKERTKLRDEDVLDNVDVYVDERKEKVQDGKEDGKESETSGKDEHGDGKSEKTGEGNSSVAAVKWDESNVVDAMMLGDAIQAFLRGMGTASAAPASPVPEKKVLFKRNS